MQGPIGLNTLARGGLLLGSKDKDRARAGQLLEPTPLILTTHIQYLSSTLPPFQAL